MKNTLQFKCGSCGETHEGLPDLGFPEPAHIFERSEEEREGIVISSDMCVVEDRDHFVRGVLPIPVIDQEDCEFMIGVWVSLSPKNFQRYKELFDVKGPREERYFGWLCNRIPGYEDTLHLATEVRLQAYPDRPRIVLEPTDHLLAVHQREGRSTEEVLAYIHQVGGFDSKKV